MVPLLGERTYQVGRTPTVELYFADELVSRLDGFLYFDPRSTDAVYRDRFPFAFPVTLSGR
jgi:hypothetical protein